MLFYTLKLFHIISAAILLTGMAASFLLWKKSSGSATTSQKIQMNTLLIIIPFALLQLITGFTLINFERDELSSGWIIGSVVSFLIVLGSWIGFNYFLWAAEKNIFFRRMQIILLSSAAIAMFCLLFLMANK